MLVHVVAVSGAAAAQMQEWWLSDWKVPASIPCSYFGGVSLRRTLNPKLHLTLLLLMSVTDFCKNHSKIDNFFV